MARTVPSPPGALLPRGTAAPCGDRFISSNFRLPEVVVIYLSTAPDSSARLYLRANLNRWKEMGGLNSGYAQETPSQAENSPPSFSPVTPRACALHALSPPHEFSCSAHCHPQWPPQYAISQTRMCHKTINSSHTHTPRSTTLMHAAEIAAGPGMFRRCSSSDQPVPC